mgnify:FL=1|jgi:hypothetical protein
MDMNRNFYQAPTLEVESYLAEQGFASSIDAFFDMDDVVFEDEKVEW